MEQKIHKKIIARKLLHISVNIYNVIIAFTVISWNVMGDINIVVDPKYRLNGVVFGTRSRTDVLLFAPRKNILLFNKFINFINNCKLINHRD